MSNLDYAFLYSYVWYVEYSYAWYVVFSFNSPIFNWWVAVIVINWWPREMIQHQPTDDRVTTVVCINMPALRNTCISIDKTFLQYMDACGQAALIATASLRMNMTMSRLPLVVVGRVLNRRVMPRHATCPKFVVHCWNSVICCPIYIIIYEYWN